MAWRAANSLRTLLTQINEEWPDRSKASDGFIGDAAHAAVASDHNPNAAGVVCALDITSDPDEFDVHALADRLLAVRHPDLKYIISNGRIAGAWTNWKWVKYYGIDPHDTHIHVSVGKGGDGFSTQPYDDTNQWNIKEEEEMADPGDYRVNKGDIQNVKGWLGLPVNDGDYGFVGYSWKEFVTAIFTGAEWKNHVAQSDTEANKKLAQIKALLE